MKNNVPAQSPSPDPRRRLVAVSALLEEPAARELIARYSRARAVEALRQALDFYRANLTSTDAPPSIPEIIEKARALILRHERERLRPIINATGVILHTGLGRAVLPSRAARALGRLDRCCNLQLDMESGGRGKRNYLSEHLLCRLTGAEAAVIVNNNAAATLLVLAVLCAGREVIVSRGQLIEIGGAFRLPDCIHQSGAVLVEVGTTNKTHLRDYAAALSEATGAILRVNPSNYRIIGFTKEVSTAELVALKEKQPLLVIDDLGCGALVNLEAYGLPHEPTVQESLAAGADVALFSGDKLIGGPQAGIIVGKKELIQKIKQHPLTRMLRVGKLTDMALEETLRLFLEPETLLKENPTLRMLTTPEGHLRERALHLKGEIEKGFGLTSAAGSEGEVGPAEEARPERLARPEGEVSPLTVRVIAGESAVGGGSLPTTPLPSWLVALSSAAHSADELSRCLRQNEPPIIARIENAEVLLDLRTIFEDEEAAIAQALRRIFNR